MFSLVNKYWKILMWLPIIFLVFSAALLASNQLTKGSILERDIELAGGRMIVVAVGGVDINAVRQALPEAKVQVTSGISKNLIVELPFDADENEAIEKLRGAVDFRSEPTVRIVGPAIGELFFQQAQLSLIAAFVFMAVIVFILFRSLVPSSIVILSVSVDIVGTMGVMSLFGIALSLPVLAALLMLIGYSVDTDILLTTNMLKRSGGIDERVRNAMKTGLMLSATTLTALVFLFFLTGSAVLEQIALVLIIGLVLDVFATWFTNAGVLRWRLERKAK